MKASKTENRFETEFQQPKTGLPNKLVLTSLERTAQTHVSRQNLAYRLTIWTKQFCSNDTLNLLKVLKRTVLNAQYY